jgi:parallel beta-helix repeat protein
MKRIILAIWIGLAGTSYGQSIAIPTNFLPEASVTLLKANGSATPYTTVNAAMDAATAGDTIILSKGTFALSAELTVDVQVTIRGQGYGTVLSRAGNIATVTADNVIFERLRTDGRLVFSSAEKCLIDGCWLDGNAQTAAVHCIASAHYLKISNCDVTRGTNGLYFKTVNGPQISNCTIHDCTQDGIHCDVDPANGGAHYGVGATDTDGTPPDKNNPPIINGNIIYANGRYGVYLNTTHDIVITGNNFEDNTDAGLYAYVPVQTVVSGNQFERNSGTTANDTKGEIIFELAADPGTEFTSSSGFIDSNDIGNFNQGIQIICTDSEAYDIRISNNNIIGGVGSAPIHARAIFVRDYKAGIGLHIAGNMIQGVAPTTTRGINVGEFTGSVIDASRVVIQGNNIREVDRGIQLNRVSNVKVIGNTLRECNSWGFVNFGASESQIINNVFESNTTAELINDDDDPSYVSRGNTGWPDYNEIMAHWAFEDALTDASGEVFTLTLNSSPAYAAGKIGRCLDFDGTDDYALTSAVALTTSVSSDLTMECWFKCGTQDSDAGAERRSLIIKGDHASNFITLGMFRGGHANESKLSFKSGAGEIISAGTYADSVWHHVVGVRSGTAMSLYIDGVLENTATSSGTIASGFTHVGGHGFETARCFDGTIDDVRLYRAALTSAEVRERYAGSANQLNGIGFGATGLALLDDSTAATARGTIGLNVRPITIIVTAPNVNTATGDDQACFIVPSQLNGADITSVYIATPEAGTTGTTNVDLRRVRSGATVDVLSTNVTIDSTELTSATAATPAVINTSNDDLATGDLIYVDVDAVHTTPAQGLQITIGVTL